MCENAILHCVVYTLQLYYLPLVKTYLYTIANDKAELYMIILMYETLIVKSNSIFLLK